MSTLITNIQGYSIHDGPGIRTAVFLKGCSLECQWCSNPECISPRPQVGFIKALCTKCGKCAGVCPAQALVYRAGTFPRSEALLQPQFVRDLFEKCRRAGVHTCIETSGCAAESALRQAIPYIDYVLYDLKHMDSEKHRRYTGKPNSLI